MRGTWLMHVLHMTHSYARHDTFIRVTCPICICDMTQSFAWYDPFVDVTRLIRTCDVTHSYEWYGLFIRVTWLICMCDMTHSYVWRNSFTCDMKVTYTHALRYVMSWHLCAMPHTHVWCEACAHAPHHPPATHSHTHALFCKRTRIFFTKKTRSLTKYSRAVSHSLARALSPQPLLSRARTLSPWQESSSPFHTFTTCYPSSWRAMSLLSLLLRLPLSRSYLRMWIHSCMCVHICRARDSRSVYLCFQHHHSRGRIWIHICICIFRFHVCE